MDKEDKIDNFLNALGGGTDREFASGILEAHDWDLQAAMMAVLGEEPPARPPAAAAPPAGDPLGVPDIGGGGDVRAPMRTGYNDVLMGPQSRTEELRQQREAEERKREAELERQRQIEAQRKAAEQAEFRRNEQQAATSRQEAAVSALERRKAAMKAKMEEQRRAAGLAADPSAEASTPAPAAAQPEDPPAATPAATPAAPQAASLPTIADRLAAANPPAPAPATSSQQHSEESAPKVQRRADEAQAASVKEKEAPQPSAAAQALMALRKKYKEQDPEGLTTCLSTIRTYLNNLAVSPHEPKFQRINCENNAFRTRVAPFEGAVDILLACGFQQDGTSLAVPADFAKTKGSKVWDVLAKVDVTIEQVKPKV
mmetsp:Transcript_15720/g.36896  ORF Transcript_15720/g.36896 Transcript_15720/m.36896 type:complete len:371 (+) Transcript_15720:88-1200(+)